MVRKKGRLWGFTNEEFTHIVSNSYFMVDILETLGYSRTSGTMRRYVKKRIEELGIDTSHFIGQKGAVGRSVRIPKYSLEEILVENSPYRSTSRLKAKLIKEALLENRCSECAIPPIWNNRPLTLQLDHINGVNNDHRIFNLRLLCPNCHTQTETYGRKNGERSGVADYESSLKVLVSKKEERIKTLIEKKPVKTTRVRNSVSEKVCGHCEKLFKPKSNRQVGKYCSIECRAFGRRVAPRPTKVELEKLLKNHSFVALGEIFGVSDNAVRKWCKSYDIEIKQSS